MTNIDLLQIGHERHGDARMMVKINVSDSPHVELPSAHRHRFYAVYWIHEGQGVHSIDFCDYEIMPDRVFFVRPDQVHFMQLINSRILLEIKRQLLENEKTVSEIAFSVGFDELSYFSRFFRRMEGISPVEFRIKCTKDSNQINRNVETLIILPFLDIILVRLVDKSKSFVGNTAGSVEFHEVFFAI